MPGAEGPLTEDRRAAGERPGPDPQQIVAQTAARLQHLLRQPLRPGLHVVATPIGNLGDITLRAVTTLALVDLVLCEDTRRSRPLLQQFGIGTPLRAYHDHNADRERPDILARLAAGARIALISDAGTPLISDPGYKLVREAAAAGHHVEATPGPSSVTAALSIAGLATDAFQFAGFLPAKAKARRERIAELAGVRATLVIFESANRLPETLGELAAGLGDREVVVARELTKLHEEVVRGRLPGLAADRREWLGEAVIVVAPPAERETDDAAIVAALREALPTMSLRDAARHVAEHTGVARGRVYDLAVGLKRDTDGDARDDEADP